MIPIQLIVDIASFLADAAILIVFIFELHGNAIDRKLQEKQIEVLEKLSDVLGEKTVQEIALLEDVHAELADINDKQLDMAGEGYELDSNRNGQQQTGEVELASVVADAPANSRG